jgi:hypothetical protein
LSIEFYKIENNKKIFDNKGMRKVQHSVRWERWLANAVDEWGRENGGKNFSDSVNYLLACELDRRGYKREFYEPGIYEKSGPESARPHVLESKENSDPAEGGKIKNPGKRA